jgi:hypothetical protein
VPKHCHVKIAADDRRDIAQARSELTEPRERARSERAHLLGQRQRVARNRAGALAHRARALDHHEWIAFAESPHSLGERRLRSIVPR